MDIKALYEIDMLSIPQIVEITGLNRSKVRSKLLMAGVVLRSRRAGVQLRCGDLSAMRKGKRRVFTQEWKNNIRAGRLAWAENNAKGYRTTTNGYKEFTRRAEKGRPCHAVSMEKRIGRRLKKDECVHHIDGNKENNDEINLAFMTRAAHARLHRLFEEFYRNMKRERDENDRLC